MEKEKGSHVSLLRKRSSDNYIKSRLPSIDEKCHLVKAISEMKEKKCNVENKKSDTEIVPIKATDLEMLPDKKKLVSPPQPPPPPPVPLLKNLKNNKETTALKHASCSNSLRSFYWTTIPKKSGTIWSEISVTDDGLPSKMSELLEGMFSAELKNKKNKAHNASFKLVRKTKAVLPMVIGEARANNVSILMKRFVDFPGGIDGIIRAILEGAGLHLDDLTAIYQIASKEDECKKLQCCDFDLLAPPERTLFSMAAIPRFKTKTKCRIVMELWNSQCQFAEKMLDSIKKACSEIRHSSKFKKILEVVLYVGNTLNRGTARGNAGGMRVDSLSKLSDTKITGYTVDMNSARQERTKSSLCTNNSNMQLEDCVLSLLDFVAAVIRETNSEEAVQGFLRSELRELSEAVAYSEEGVSEIGKEVYSEFEILKNEIESMAGSTPWKILKELSSEEAFEKVKDLGKFKSEQKIFFLELHSFVLEKEVEKEELMKRFELSEQHVADMALWLGEPSGQDSKTVLKTLDNFCTDFDLSYQQLAPFFPIIE